MLDLLPFSPGDLTLLWHVADSDWTKWWACRNGKTGILGEDGVWRDDSIDWREESRRKWAKFDLTYSSYIPWVHKDEELCALLDEWNPYQGLDVVHWWEVRKDRSREGDLPMYEKVFDVAERVIEVLIARDKVCGDEVAQRRHEWLLLAAQHARFEFETLWQYGTKLTALGCDGPFYLVEVERCGGGATDICARYGRELLSAFVRAEQRLREIDDQGLAFGWEVWGDLLQGIEKRWNPSEASPWNTPIGTMNLWLAAKSPEECMWPRTMKDRPITHW